MNMFKTNLSVGAVQRVVATLVALAIVMWSIGFTTTAQAANLVDVSNTLTDSDLSVQSGHDIQFEIPAGSALAATSTVSITFPTGFTNVDSSVIGDLTVTSSGTPQAIGSFDSTGQVISFDNVTASAGQVVRIIIAEGVITNPGVTDSYEFVIDTGNGDTGRTRVAVLDNVLVTAEVQTVFDFTVTGLATSTAVNGTSTTGLTTATSVPFYVLDPGVPETLAQRLNVTTNANSGFVVTVETDGDLESANGAIIDTFSNAGDQANPLDWTANPPLNQIGTSTTWGHWGMTTTDGDLNSLGGFYTGEFGANEFVAASTTPREVFHHDGPADGTTANIGQVDVAYQVQITPLQEAADDYNTTLTYIATPTF
jgi:hypothetical protein